MRITLGRRDRGWTTLLTVAKKAAVGAGKSVAAKAAPAIGMAKSAGGFGTAPTGAPSTGGPPAGSGGGWDALVGDASQMGPGVAQQAVGEKAGLLGWGQKPEDQALVDPSSLNTFMANLEQAQRMNSGTGFEGQLPSFDWSQLWM